MNGDVEYSKDSMALRFEYDGWLAAGHATVFQGREIVHQSRVEKGEMVNEWSPEPGEYRIVFNEHDAIAVTVVTGARLKS